MTTSQASTATFDIRNVIGALLGFYGIVLIICSFVLDPGSVSYTHLTLPTIAAECRSRWSPYH